jgi:hypothetical protein
MADRFSHPRFDRLAQFAQPPLEEMVRPLDDDQFLRLWDGSYQGLESCSRPKLVACPAYQQFWLPTLLQKLVRINSRLFAIGGHRNNRRASANHCLYPRIRTGRTHSHRRPERESRKDQGQMKLRIQPFERGADIIDFADALVVFSLAQSRPSKIEPQHRKSERVQRLHRVKYNFVVQRPAIQRVRMAHERSMRSILRANVQQSLKISRRSFEDERPN